MIRLASIALLAGCTADVIVTPEVLPSSGYEEVRIDVVPAGIDPADVTAVRIAGRRVLDLRDAGDGTLVGLGQGGPEGPVDVTVVTARGTTTWPGAAQHAGPIDPALARLVTVGASLGMGVQGGTPSLHGGRVAPSAQLARLAGSDHALPLLVADLLPQIGPDDLGPPPTCAVPSIPEFVADAAIDVVGALGGADGFDYGRARLDPDVEVANLAVGDFDVGTVLRGPESFSQHFLAHLVYAPEGAFADEVDAAPIALAEAAEPTAIVAFDLYGNDVIGSIVNAPGLLLSQVTPLDVLDPDLTALVARLAGTGAEVFLGTLPRPSLLPIAKTRRADAIAALTADGWTEADATAEIDARLAAIDARAAAFDAVLLREAARHDNVHVVDLRAEADRLAAEGLTIGDSVVTVDPLGGLLSTDGVHFSDTGYAWMASLYAAAMEDALGIELPDLDLAAVHAADPYSPSALVAAGLDPACIGG